MSDGEERGEVGRELLIQGGVVAGALLAIAAAILTGAFPQPFPLAEFLLTVAAAAATREFGLALPGRGFASFVLGVMLFALLRHGWAYGALVALVGMPAGDIPFRRLPLRAAVVNAGHLTFGTAGMGFLYERLGGTTGLAAFGDGNLLPLAVLLISLPLLINATFYLELASAHATAWVDARLTLRWESIVYALSAALAAGFLWGAAGPQDARFRAAALGVMLGLAALAHYVARTGVRADELALIQRFTRTLATDVNLDRSFAAIQQLTQRLVPWDEMGFARYDEARHEMVVVADSALARSETRYHADQGLTGEAVRRRAPVIRRGGPEQEGATTATTWPGSEILVPLYQGDRLVGAWSVRHRDAAMYRELDAELLDSLAPNLALTLRLHALVAPLVNAGEQTTQYVEHLTATSQQIHASSEEVTAATQRAEAGATTAADLVSRAEHAMEALHSGAQEAAAAGEETHRASQAVERAAQTVRAATQRTAAALERVGDTVGQGAAEVGRLREAAEQVGRFAETIGAVAAQTNMLALNATIEAARAGAHGSGFAVVADEVRRLAEQSGREAAQAARTTTETRRVLDRAAELLERMRHEIGEIASAAQGWVAELERIVVASESAAELSTKMIEFPRRNIERTAEMMQMLERLRLASHESAGEAQVVAAAAAEQLAAIENLSKSAIQLSQSAEQLSQAARIVQA